MFTVRYFIVLCSLIVLADVCYACGKDFTMLTANTWSLGANVNDGQKKLAKHIKAISPDIVALQDYPDHLVEKFENELEKEWYIERKIGMGAILSKYPIIPGSRVDTPGAFGCRINMTAYNIVISVWNCLFYSSSYGPYAAINKLVTESRIFTVGDSHPDGGRYHQINSIAQNPKYLQMSKVTDEEPLFLMGCLNTPSHLDWIASTKKSHGDWIVDWLVTKEIDSKMGLTDSFREANPDPVEAPGNTWSPVYKFSAAGWDYKIPEPQDRVDYIYYKSKNVGTLYSNTYFGAAFSKVAPNYVNNDFPSSYAWVISKFHYYK